MESKWMMLALVLLLQLGGCTTYYQYRSDGEVQYPDDGSRKAVMYWFGEEGRLWYGKAYAQPDSGLTLRICEIGPKPFAQSDRERLELASKANDLRIADIGASGELQAVDPPLRLSTGEYCGLILVDGQTVTTAQLLENRIPSVAILCTSIRNPDRYPEAGIYRFEGITRLETSKHDRTGPDVCPAAGDGE